MASIGQIYGLEKIKLSYDRLVEHGILRMQSLGGQHF
jgi:hypothetical protein